MDVSHKTARVEAIRRMLTPMVEQNLITPEQEANCERMLVNLAEHASVDPGPGMRHADFFTHEELVAAVFNWCTPEALAFAMQLNVEGVAY